MSDLPEEIRVPATLTVNGRLKPKRKSPTAKVVRLGGSVTIALDVNVPAPYSTFPLLKETVEGILSAVIGRLEQSLKTKLPGDYQKWSRAKATVKTM